VIRSVFGFWRKSLSVRLLLLFIFTCLLLVILLISSARHGFHSQWQVTIKPHLVQYLAYLTEDIGSPPDTQRAVELARVLPVNIYIEGPNTHFSTNNTPLDVSDLSFEQRRYRKRHSKRQNALREKGFEIGEHDDRTVLRHRSGEYSIYFELLHLRPGPHNDGGSLLALLALLATLIGCYCILRKMLKPVADISDGVKRMGAGELNYRIPVRAHNDLGRLVTSINTMASDIEKMLDAKRQLLLGASHELRSPLTRARVATEMLPESSNKQRLTDDLHEMENTDLPDILLDRTRIQLLLRNLIGNALTHGSASATEHQQTQVRSPACRVTAEINPTDNHGSDTPVLTLAVTDNGPGIDPAHIEQLTEPFYRTDESRTRSTGGFGLGLYLCKLIAEAHGGRLHIESTTGTGTTVSVHIPVHFSAHS